jgi:MFS family permease
MAPRMDRRSAVRRIALARVVSSTGSTAAYTALTYAIYHRTGSTTWVSVAVFVTLAANGILMPVGGWIGDRFDRRRVMIASDLLAAVLFVAVAFVEEPWLLVSLAFLATVAEIPFMPASSAAIPNLAAPEDLAWANGRIASAIATGITIGPAVAGGLIAVFGPSLAFGLNALSFVLSAAIVSTVHGQFADRDRPPDEDHGSARAGVDFVRHSAALRTIVLAEFVAFIGVGLIIVSDAPLAEHFDVGSVGYGLLVAVWGLGMIGGAWWAGRALKEHREPMALLVGSLVTAAGLGICAVLPWFWLILVSSIGAGAGHGVQNVARQGVVQRRSPDAVRSRVFAAVEAIANVAFIASLAVAGPVVEAIGPRAGYGLGGVIWILGALVLAPAVLRAGGALRMAEPGRPTAASPG